MADEVKPDEQTSAAAESTPEASQRQRPAAKLLGAVAGLIGAGGLLAVLAVPSKQESRRFVGPYFVALAEEAIPVNTRDANYTRYVKFVPHAEYVAYEEGYVTGRTKDPFYTTYLRARIEEVASDKDIENVLEGAQRQVFAEELRHAIAPIVFPIHIGETQFPLDVDERTGLRPGLSHISSTFRGGYHEHVLHVDGPSKKLRLDDGPEVAFLGGEEDLRVPAADGSYVFVDVTHLNGDFVGEVGIGVHGRLRKVLILQGIAQ